MRIMELKNHNYFGIYNQNWHYEEQGGLVMKILEVKIQENEKKRRQPRNNYSIWACIDIEVNIYTELKTTAENMGLWRKELLRTRDCGEENCREHGIVEN